MERTTIFQDEELHETLDELHKRMDVVAEGLPKLYWQKHSEIMKTPYNHSTDQLRDMEKLGEYATAAKLAHQLRALVGKLETQSRKD